MPRAARRLSGTRLRRPYAPTQGEWTAARELQLYADNTQELYERSWKPIVRNLIRKMRRGVYDPERAPDAFMYHAEHAAKSYVREFGGNWHDVFPMGVRRAAADLWARAFESEYEHGELSHLSGLGGQHDPMEHAWADQALFPQIARAIDEGGGWANVKRLPGGMEYIHDLIDRGILEYEDGFVRWADQGRADGWGDAPRSTR